MFFIRCYHFSLLHNSVNQGPKCVCQSCTLVLLMSQMKNSCPHSLFQCLQLSNPVTPSLGASRMIGRYRLPSPDEGRSVTLREGVKDNCDSLVWVYFLLCCLHLLFTLKPRCLLYDVPPQTFIRPPMTAAFHIVARLLTGGDHLSMFADIYECLLQFPLHNACSHTFIQVSVFYSPGCPGAKKTEFLTSVLDALSTDMVHAVTDPASAGRYDTACEFLQLTICQFTV